MLGHSAPNKLSFYLKADCLYHYQKVTKSKDLPCHQPIWKWYVVLPRCFSSGTRGKHSNEETTVESSWGKLITKAYFDLTHYEINNFETLHRQISPFGGQFSKISHLVEALSFSSQLDALQTMRRWFHTRTCVSVQFAWHLWLRVLVTLAETLLPSKLLYCNSRLFRADTDISDSDWQATLNFFTGALTLAF